MPELDPETIRRIREAAAAQRTYAREARDRAIEMRQQVRPVRESLAEDSTAGRAPSSGAFAALPTPAAIVGGQGRILATNPTWRGRFRHRISIGDDFFSRWASLGGDAAVAEGLHHVIEGGAGTDVEIDLSEDRERVQVLITPTAHSVGAALVVIIDVTDRYRREQAALFDATHDALTGLASRALLTREVGAALETARRYGGGFGLVYLDLDDFKPVNDVHGHRIGDDLLRGVADRWQAMVRAPDLLARIGGDEFVVLVSHLDDPSDLTALADRLQAALDEPFALGGVEVQLSVTAGVAVPSPDDTVEAALAGADHAMYEAKRARRADRRREDG